MPWRWTRRGVVIESAVVVSLVVVLALILLWVRGTGRALVTEAERVAEMEVVAEMPTDLPTSTPSPTPLATAVVSPTLAVSATAQAAAIEHVVQSGETLVAIAAQHGVTVDSIVEANSLEHPEALSVGQALEVPVPGGAQEGASGAAEPDTEADSQAPDEASDQQSAAEGEDAGEGPVSDESGNLVVGQSVTHVVKSGDTLGGIAARYGVPLDDLLQLNGDWLSSVDQTLGIGDVVVVQGAQVMTPTAQPVDFSTTEPDSVEIVALATPRDGPNAPDYELRFRAPAVLGPGPDAVVTTDEVMLRWASVGVLPSGAAYVVSVRDSQAPPDEALVAWVTTNATALKVPSAFRPAIGSSRQLAWTVDVRRRGGRLVDREGDLLSPEPEPIVFTWSPGG